MPATTTMADSGDRIPSRLLCSPAPAEQQQEQLQCPRCESTNTKFCYYNNYNLSQPRHFCKNCRRYWTKGGALRNIPVGGGSRKSSAKRHRSAASATADAPPPSSASHTPETSPRASASINPMAVDFGFGPLLPSSAAAYGGFLALGAEPLLSRAGFGLGFAPPGLEEMVGLGLTARAMFPTAPTPEMVHSGANAWHLSSGADVFSDAGDCFSWPELAISAPGKGLP